MSSELKIVPLSRGSSDILRFLKVSYAIYDGDPHWVAPLLMDLKKVFTDENPLFHHAKVQLWVATRDHHDVGRIAAIIDEHYNKTAKEPAAFFGFFECINEPEISHALFQVALEWSQQP